MANGAMGKSEAMAISDDLGGDPACWAHLVDTEGPGDLATREDLELLVRSFYRQAAQDELLGPVFEAADVDWAAHIPKLVDFWAWQLFGQRGYEGHPLLAHRPLQATTPFRPAHYARWLELFVDTVDEWFAGPVADIAKLKAEKMARALQRLMAGASEPGDRPVAVTFTGPPGRTPDA
jgi:hemoglobin